VTTGDTGPHPLNVESFRLVTEKPVERRLRYETAGRELVRTVLALAAFVLVALTVWWAFRASQGDRWESAKEWLQVVLPAETGILGSALGFYFGSRQGAREES
jgi:hypothetical protein